IEQDNMNPAAAQPVKMYLCPSRRSSSTQPFDDYGTAHHVSWGFRGSASTWYGAIGGPYTATGNRAATRIGTIKDGTSNTLMIAHKGVSPKYYEGGSPAAYGQTRTDFNWACWDGGSVVGDHWEHKRQPGFIVQDDFDEENMQYYLSTPHTQVMPVSYCDGSVRGLRVNAESELLFRLWSTSDGQTIKNEDDL
ncbi:MAG: DUF1559 domain-containing protein, partial [Gemmataceae bacterium]